VKWYHASPQHFKPGDVIGRHDLKVYMTCSPEPHFTIYDKAVEENWTVYEVRPLGRIHEGWWDDAYTIQAEVIRKVGHSRGLANNFKKHFKPGQWKSKKGSQVLWKRYL